jgi:hypothetical protein
MERGRIIGYSAIGIVTALMIYFFVAIAWVLYFK